MKPSHFVTPRKLSQGHWDSDGQAFHHFPDPSSHDWSDWAILAIAVVVAIGIAGGLL